MSTPNWETCKENVLPTKGGRSVELLNKIVIQRNTQQLESDER
jgi:hypothetical protein